MSTTFDNLSLDDYNNLSQSDKLKAEAIFKKEAITMKNRLTSMLLSDSIKLDEATLASKESRGTEQMSASFITGVPIIILNEEV